MATPLRFHLDEHISPAVAAGLRLAAGIDATTAIEAGLVGVSDAEQLAFARQAGRVMVSHDRQFPQLHADGETHAGIAYCYQQKYSIGELVRALLMLRDRLNAEEMEGTLEYL